MFKESVVAAEQEADLMFAGDTGGARQFKKTNQADEEASLSVQEGFNRTKGLQ